MERRSDSKLEYAVLVAAVFMFTIIIVGMIRTEKPEVLTVLGGALTLVVGYVGMAGQHLWGQSKQQQERMRKEQGNGNGTDRLVVLLALAVLASCASDGSFAGRGEQVDKAATLEATCRGLEQADVAFQALVAARPGLVDANGLAVERAVMETIKPVCTPPYRGDLDAGIATAIAALVNVSTLVQTWQAVPVSP